MRRRFEIVDNVNINDFSTAEERTHIAEKIIDKLNKQLDTCRTSTVVTTQYGVCV